MAGRNHRGHSYLPGLPGWIVVCGGGRNPSLSFRLRHHTGLGFGTGLSCDGPSCGGSAACCCSVAAENLNESKRRGLQAPGQPMQFASRCCVVRWVILSSDRLSCRVPVTFVAGDGPTHAICFVLLCGYVGHPIPFFGIGCPAVPRRVRWSAYGLYP